MLSYERVIWVITIILVILAVINVVTAKSSNNDENIIPYQVFDHPGTADTGNRPLAPKGNMKYANSPI